jgi:dihydropteroate synthase
VVEVVLRDLEAAIDRAVRQGVSAGAILIDPGLGFGKTWRENFAILRRLATLRSLGYPILVGPSRKGMIGKVLGVRVKDRMEGTLALVTIAVAAGADMVRVHDVREMARAARMADALAR